MYNGFFILGFINFAKDYATITTNITMIISSLLKQSKNKRYAPRIIEKIIRCTKYLARAYPLELMCNDEIHVIFIYLEKFLCFDNLSVQYATIETFSFIFNVNWISSNLLDVPSFKIFHITIFDKIVECLSKFSANDEHKDSIYKLFSVSLQCYSSILIQNNILRKKCWFLVAELFLKYHLNLNQGKQT